jgi:hypothetical protein
LLRRWRADLRDPTRRVGGTYLAAGAVMRTLGFVVLLAGCYAPLDLPVSSGASRTDASMDCSQYTSAATCSADSRCEAVGCDACGTETFNGCVPTGTPPPDCPGFPCVADCAQRTTEADCDADLSCFAVYEDPGTCDCAGIGCCMVFARCDPAPARCAPNGPDCGLLPIVCGSGYEPIIEMEENGCLSGCAKASSCEGPD